MIKKPFFSIVIPTYNRANFLKTTIAITLQQSFKDFEIIISNNCSTDNTSEVVKAFKDKRIRYFENKKNIGADPNMKKVISYARGKYIFTMGDDDFILYDNTLAEIKKIIDEKQYGFIRLNLIERKLIGTGIRKNIVKLNNDKYINKQASPQKIIDFFIEVAASHFAGLVIKNEANIAEKMIDSEVNPWIKIIFDTTEKYGALFLGDRYMIITWSQGGILNHYELKKNRLMVENYFNVILTYFPKDQREDLKLQYYKKFIILQPVIKLYGGIQQLIIFNKRLLFVEKKLRYNMFFWMFFVIALLVPRVVWKLVRIIQHSLNDTIKELSDFDQIKKRYTYFQKTYSL